MPLKFHNSLNNRKEEFKPIQKNKVGIYVCGVTVYDRCHLGHARGAINFDVLRKFLKYLGFEVTFVKNYTDIDDKIITRANERGISIMELTEEMIAYHDHDMSLLGIEPPDEKPKATDHIAEIIELAVNLKKSGFAYEADGDVFFEVRKFPEYGKLSGKKIDNLISGMRVEKNSNKKDPLDFNLWKAAKEGEPSWDSPWGKGRPGWHIECSAMSLKYLGENFDIHAGGSDLTFPHHENEIAQSEGCHQKPYANFWLHNGMIEIDGQKMSKSLGNFATIESLTKTYHPELVRFFVISSQYRKVIHFNHENLKQTLEGLDRLYTALDIAEFEKRDCVILEDSLEEKLKNQFIDALSDDLNTPLAISVLFELSKEINKSSLVEEKTNLANLLLELANLLGILREDPRHWFQYERIKENKVKKDIDENEINNLIEDRKKAREDKNWAKADEIRDTLAGMSIILEDKDGKTIWKRK